MPVLDRLPLRRSRARDGLSLWSRRALGGEGEGAGSPTRVVDGVKTTWPAADWTRDV